MTVAFAPLGGTTTAPFANVLIAEVDTQLPCRQYDPDLWFADTPAGLEVAKSLCQACPLKVECLAGALERAEPWGVWGGEIFERGVVVARKRPRGRPRKEDLLADAGMRVAAGSRASAGGLPENVCKVA